MATHITPKKVLEGDLRMSFVGHIVVEIHLGLGQDDQVLLFARVSHLKVGSIVEVVSHLPVRRYLHGRPSVREGQPLRFRRLLSHTRNQGYRGWGSAVNG
jgi:hypothetical protein